MDSKLNDEETAKETPKRWSLYRFIEELKQELKKVSWTSASELKTATKTVIISTFAFGFGIYLVDLVIKGALATVGMLFRWFFG
jgi:preprotein translocase subunit SecE